MNKTDILNFTARKLAPYIMLFGFYVVTHGHLSPGGGFQGGVVLASGMILLLLCKDVSEVEKIFPSRRFSFLESMGYFFFLLAGLAGIAAGGYFLGPVAPSTSVFGGLPGAGFILVLNIIIGVKVGAGISLICYYLLREE